MTTSPNRPHDLIGFNRAILPQFERICAPLSNHLPIYLRFLRIFSDGTYLLLSESTDYLRYYVESVKTLSGTLLEGELKKTPSDGQHYYLWPKVWQDPLLQILLDHGFSHGFDFYQCNSEHVDVWSFCTDKTNEQMSSFYIDNIHLLKQFINFSQPHIENLVGGLPIFNRVCQAAKQDFIAQEKIEAFLHEMSSSSHLLKINGKLVALTPQEYRCVQGLSLCRTAKEIANGLNIAPRTVEAYFSSIRMKTGVTSRSVLLSAIKKAEI